MPSYAALLGHQPRISVAELAASIGGFRSPRFTGKGFLIFDADDELKADFIDTLGGTVILARQVGNANLSLADIPGVLVKELEGAKRGKLIFSYRTSGLAPRAVHDLYRQTKDKLKRAGRPSRYVGNDRKAAPSVVLHEQDMLSGKLGCELTVLFDQESGDLWVGHTIGAQDIDAYTKRDIDKPVRDTRVGLLPPKLAQVLLNLGFWAAKQTGNKEAAKKKPAVLVYDPFCGTGVIPMESLLRGWPVLASDMSIKAVNDTQKNLDWLRKEEGIAKKDVASTVWKHDGRKPFELKQKPDMIVTETTLGPNLVKKATLKEVSKLKTDNEAVQVAFLENAVAEFPGVPLVMTYPVWYHSKGRQPLEHIWKTIAKLNLQAVLPEGSEPDDAERGTLLYRRPEQFVGREIVVLVPKA